MGMKEKKAKVVQEVSHLTILSLEAPSDVGVPAVLEQKTTICCKYLYLLASLKASPGLGGVYEDKPQRCGRKPCSWAKYHDKRGQNQGFSSTVRVEEALRFLPHNCPRMYRALFFVRLLWEPRLPKQRRRVLEVFVSYQTKWRVRVSNVYVKRPFFPDRIYRGESPIFSAKRC
jgi:hypothetical protein